MMRHCSFEGRLEGLGVLRVFCLGYFVVCCWGFLAVENWWVVTVLKKIIRSVMKMDHNSSGYLWKKKKCSKDEENRIIQ